MKRLLVASLAATGAGATRALTAAQDHYLGDVLRLRAGDEVLLFDRDGLAAPARLATAGPRGEVVLLMAPQQVSRPSCLTVAVPAPRGERADWLVEKLTELGVAHIDWLITARSQPHSQRMRMPRWERIAAAAAGQAQAPAPPAIAAARPLAGWLAARPPSEGLFVAAMDGGPAPSPRARPAAGLAVVVGPEGGLDAAEQGSLRTAGAEPVRLAAQVLRVETAAVVAAAILWPPPGGEPREPC